jgi:hypothetical protein
VEPRVVPHVERPPTVDVTRELGDGGGGLVDGGELDDARASGATGHDVKEDLGGDDLAGGLEELDEVFVGG